MGKYKEHREEGPAVVSAAGTEQWYRNGRLYEPTEPTAHELLQDAAEAMRKGEWNPANGPYQPKSPYEQSRYPHDRRGLFPNYDEPPATITFGGKGEPGADAPRPGGVKAAAAAAATEAAKPKTTKPKATDRGEDR